MTPRGAERAVALLPIKGHSERIAGKNFKDFCGKPLFRWILDTLLSVPEIGLVVINTDARPAFEALGVDRLPRVQLRDRKAELCGDLVSMNLILEDDIAAVPADLLRHDARDESAARSRDHFPRDRGLSRGARPRRRGFVVHGQPVPVTVLRARQRGLSITIPRIWSALRISSPGSRKTRISTCSPQTASARQRRVSAVDR